METTKVGIRQFRADLAEYIASSTPVAVTRHGQTVGYFIPAQAQVDADIAALKKASKTLDRMLAAQGVDAEAVVAEHGNGGLGQRAIGPHQVFMGLIGLVEHRVSCG